MVTNKWLKKKKKNHTYSHVKSTVPELSVLLRQCTSLTEEVDEAIDTRRLFQIKLSPHSRTVYTRIQACQTSETQKHIQRTAHRTICKTIHQLEPFTQSDKPNRQKEKRKQDKRKFVKRLTWRSFTHYLSNLPKCDARAEGSHQTFKHKSVKEKEKWTERNEDTDNQVKRQIISGASFLQLSGSSQQWQRLVDQRVVPPGFCTTYAAA